MDILIVEDNKELADLLCTFLRAEDYTVSIASTGERALELFAQHGAKLVILDIIDIMLAKIRGIFKRRYAMDEFTDGLLRINRISRTVYKDNEPLTMTAKEYDLLLLLMENKGRALKKEYIFNQIWGNDSFSEPQTLTVHIKWLRQKIEDDPHHPQIIQTIWGVGYQYK